ncbi:embryonic polarity protein dorsal-like isoform X2 [Coccinella septempunctata]|uniref:embryonic polarity protein dorsal-like isoform X2 n=1 Tax=Coccinella septempunctata TaxID=41139 RepID=UPI001D092A0B|nr:embryonic polarity protein dorsal-like isoform X2 [Coccinella septempunctata]
MEGSNSSLVDAAAVSNIYENSLDSNQSFTNHSTCRKEYVEIVEQPAPKALRFRYECEGRSAGSIPGISSTAENKTYPTIQVVGYHGRAVVVVSCVTRDEPYRPHPHNLVGREGCKKGVCTLEIPPDTMSVSFSNLGIQCVKKKDIESSLKTREEIRVDPFRTGFSHRHHPTSIDLNAVRLCFQVFLEGDKKGKFTVPLPPVVSEPILDKKASADLVIVKLSDCNSHVDGGRKDIILLCEKVAKEDIQIRFFEEKDGKTVWEAYGDFQSNQVHKQTSIWFRAPKYRTLEVTEPVKAFIQLKRPSDGATSEPLPFEFLPLDAGRPSYWTLGRNFMKTRNSHLYSTLLSKNTINLMKWNPEENKLTPEIIPSDKLPAEQEVPQLFEEVIKTAETNVNEFVVDEEKDTTLLLDTVMVETNNNEITVNNNESGIIGTNVSDEISWKIPPNEDSEEKSFNRLIDEVAELDEIYSATQSNKNNFVTGGDAQVMEIDTVNNNFDDSKTYSSLQMAFKTPLNIAYRPTEDKPQYIFSTITEEKNTEKQLTKRESPIEKLPPLPPKRQKKVETYIGEESEEEKRLREALLHPKPTILRSRSFSSQPERLSGDLKYLGSTSTLPNPKKKSFFSKLFGRKNKNKSNQDLSSTYNSSKSLHTQQNDKNSKITSMSVENIQATPRCTPAREMLKPNENQTHDANNPPQVEDMDSLVKRSIAIDDESLHLSGDGLDLTEAEHYALYTVMAPHATESEFDEMSCYYAAVEGGKILS